MKQKLLAFIAVVGCWNINMSAQTIADLEANGWEKVESIENVDVDNNLFIFVDAGSSKYLIANDVANDRPCYRTLSNPLADNGQTWILEQKDDAYLLKSADGSKYFSSGPNGYDDKWTDTEENASYTFVFSDGKCSLITTNSLNQYVGPWNNNGAVAANGEEVAANKAQDNAPGFYVYSMSKTAYQAKQQALLDNATTKNPVDMTSYLINPDFYLNGLNGWTGEGTCGRYKDNEDNKGFDGQHGFIEYCYWNGAWEGSVTQTVNSLPHGYYRVKAIAQASESNVTVALQANGEEAQLHCIGATGGNVAADGSVVELGSGVAGWQYMELECSVTDGQIEIAGTATATTNARWANLDHVTLEYLCSFKMRLTELRDSATNLINSGKTYSEFAGTELSKALDNTANLTEEAEIIEAISTMENAISTLQTSMASYDILEGGVIPTNTLDGWKCTGSTGRFQLNGWSHEGEIDGSNMVSPFIEYWIGSGNILDDAEISYSLAGVQPGTIYRISILGRLLKESGGEVSGGAVFANEDSYNIENGMSCTNGMYGVYSIMGTVGNDGNLTFGFKLNGVSFNWISYKDVKIEIVNTISEVDVKELIPCAESLLEGNTTLSGLYDTFKETPNKDNYNALSAKIYVIGDLIQAYNRVEAVIDECNAKAEKLEPTGIDAYKKVVDPIKSACEEGTLETGSVDEYVKSIYDALVALAKAQKGVNVDMTSAIVNPSFELGDLTGWTINATNDMGVRHNGNNTYVTNGCDGYYLLNVWDNGKSAPVSQSITGLPNGSYRLTVACANTGATYTIMGQELGTPSRDTNADKQFEDLSCVFTVSNGEANITLATNDIWYKVDNFRLMYLGDYTALESAIATVIKDYEMGFAEGQYAPYNNIEAAEALKAAEKLFADKDALEQSTIDACVENLTSANWTVNAQEVNAVYDGNFELQPETTTSPVTVVGWSGPADSFRQLIKDTEANPGLNDASAHAALYVWGDANFLYGNTEGYTMPLAAHTIYELSFLQAGWADGGNNYFNVSVLNESGEGLASKKFDGAPSGIAKENSLVPVKVRFQTGEAGNYTLTMNPSGNTVFTDIELYTAKAEDINVTFKAEYGTMILPFDAIIPEGMAVYSVSSSTPNGEYNTLNLNEAEAIAANTPYIIQRTGAESNFTFNGIAYSEEDTYTSGLLVGAIKDVEAPAGSYVLQNQNGVLGFYQVTEGTVIKVTANHAYLNADGTNEVSAFVFDLSGDVTSVGHIAAENDALVDVYTVSGVLVRKAVKAGEALNGLQKGLYIVNGVKKAVR